MRWLIGGVHDLDSVMRVTNYYFVEHLSRRIAQGAASMALYLPAPISPLHFALRRADPRFAERCRHWGRSPHPWMPGTAQYTPLTLLPVLPGGGPLDHAAVVRASLRLTVPPIGRVLRRAGFQRPDVLVLTNLQYAWLDRIVRPRRLVYCCEDDIAGFPHAPRSLLDVERDLVRRADACFATSAHLADLLRERGAKTVHLARNGVDYDRFAAGGGGEPADLAAIAHPRVIYVGMLNSRLRVDWLDRAAAALPRHQFVLIGPEATPLDALRGRPNVHLLGSRPSESLPNYYAHSDVGIVPFRRSALTDATCPIKLYEYLAAGLPVVASRWPEMESIASPATLVDDADGFVAALRAETALPASPGFGPQAPDSRTARLVFARANSWRARFERLEATIAALPPVPR